MTYELAKQLKDAGFEMMQEPVDYSNGKPNREQMRLTNNDNDWFLLPTLSELIEACGDELNTLLKFDNFKNPYTWVASTHSPCANYFEDFKEDNCLFGEGSTPEEAVAKLWLTINKK